MKTLRESLANFGLAPMTLEEFAKDNYDYLTSLFYNAETKLSLNEYINEKHQEYLNRMDIAI